MTDTKLTVQAGDEEKELFMSYNMVKHLSASVGGLEQLPLLAADIEVHNQFICIMLAGREGKYNPEKVDDDLLEEIPVSDIERMTKWGVAHVTDFFLKRAEALHSTMTEEKDRINQASSQS